MSIERALLSVSDRTGIEPLGQALVDQGVELLSTGGTGKALRDAGLKVTEVSEYTGFPEIMDGRVKTLLPQIHGGILALRDNPDHLEAMEAHRIKKIDLVVVNLYPFQATVAKGADFATCVANIDIGGPAMVRSAAKNHKFVTVVVDPSDYSLLISEMYGNGGNTLWDTRFRLARKAFRHTADYDTAIAKYFDDERVWQTVKAGHDLAVRNPRLP